MKWDIRMFIFLLRVSDEFRCRYPTSAYPSHAIVPIRLLLFFINDPFLAIPDVDVRGRAPRLEEGGVEEVAQTNSAKNGGSDATKSNTSSALTPMPPFIWSSPTNARGITRSTSPLKLRKSVRIDVYTLCFCAEEVVRTPANCRANAFRSPSFLAAFTFIISVSTICGVFSTSSIFNVATRSRYFFTVSFEGWRPAW